jgi:hypothetical protein
METIVKNKVLNKESLLNEAYNALLDRLGAEKTLQVWQLLVPPPHGDYLAERKDIFAGKSVDKIYREARKFNRK